IAASVQAESMAAHTQAAAYASVAAPPATDFGLDDIGTYIYQISVSNPNPTTIGPSNLGLTDFLRHWARQSRILQGMARGICPWPAKINSLETSQAASVEYEDLEGDECDLQGVDWEDIGVTRRDARERRLLTYSNYVNLPGSDRWTPNLPDVALPRSESFFRFRRMDIRQNIHLAHFQLRHVFATSSRSRVFYPSIGAVQQFNPLSGHGRAIMRLSDAPASQISTLATGHGVLIAGGFGGEYILRHLDSGEPEDAACHEGVITSSISGITNHIDVHQARTSSVPLAAFASNDNVLRVLDVNTETWLSQETHDFAPNCTATSPDGRLRVMVGDTLDVVITAAESRLSGSGEPDITHRLSGHRDYGFACDWADDGWTIATAFQDKTVKIWDARRLTDSAGNAASLCTIRSEMAGVRSLRFSPVGSGRRVLVAAEEADFVNVIDARTFRSKQTIDVFGELGGISFENAGQDLMVLCCDRTRGGILQLERCGQGLEEEDRDWPRSVFTEGRRFRESASRRRRKAAALDVEVDPF
ncbi:WD40 repeat-like protein, partial [Parathielavia appendiculata]